MSDSGTDSTSEVVHEDHVAVEQSSATSEEDPTTGMALQILVGEITDFDPEGYAARPFE